MPFVGEEKLKSKIEKVNGDNQEWQQY